MQTNTIQIKRPKCDKHTSKQRNVPFGVCLSVSQYFDGYLSSYSRIRDHIEFAKATFDLEILRP